MKQPCPILSPLSGERVGKHKPQPALTKPSPPRSTLHKSHPQSLNNIGTLPYPRQRKLKRRAASLVHCRPDTPAMRLNNRLADRQAHAAALRLRREKSLKEPVGLGGWQPRPRVVDRNLDLIARAWLRFDRKHAARIAH